MAITRLKLLNRQKIAQSDIKIALETTGKAKRFTAELNLSGYRLPPDARIFVDARQLMETIRFDFGTVGKPSVRVARDISRLYGERVTFEVNVITPSGARKLASAEAIRPVNDLTGAPGSVPLLPVDSSRDLDGLVWCIEYVEIFGGRTDAPVLCIDPSAANGAASTFLQDNAARALIFPAALREVLHRILVTDEHPFEQRSEEWPDCWLRFAAKLTSDDVPSAEAPKDDKLRFADQASKAFSRQHMLLSSFISEGGR
jgi:hypothetical protein